MTNEFIFFNIYDGMFTRIYARCCVMFIHSPQLSYCDFCMPHVHLSILCCISSMSMPLLHIYCINGQFSWVHPGIPSTLCSTHTYDAVLGQFMCVNMQSFVDVQPTGDVYIHLTYWHHESNKYKYSPHIVLRRTLDVFYVSARRGGKLYLTCVSCKLSTTASARRRRYDQTTPAPRNNSTFTSVSIGLPSSPQYKTK